MSVCLTGVGNSFGSRATFKNKLELKHSRTYYYVPHGFEENPSDASQLYSVLCVEEGNNISSLASYPDVLKCTSGGRRQRRQQQRESHWNQFCSSILSSFFGYFFWAFCYPSFGYGFWKIDNLYNLFQASLYDKNKTSCFD